MKRPVRAGLFVIVAASVTSVLTAANTVPVSHADVVTNAIGVNDLKPPSCASLTLTGLVVGSGVFSGTAASELIVGSSGLDTILAGGGNDCLLAGGGVDVLNGGAGTDVCESGPGNDIFDPSCETQIQ